MKFSSLKFFIDDLFRRKLNTWNILCNVHWPILILVTKIWRRNLDYAKYFTGKNIPIYGTFFLTKLLFMLMQANACNIIIHIDQPLSWAAYLSKHSCSLMTGLYSSLLPETVSAVWHEGRTSHHASPTGQECHLATMHEALKGSINTYQHMSQRRNLGQIPYLI